MIETKEIDSVVDNFNVLASKYKNMPKKPKMRLRKRSNDKKSLSSKSNSMISKLSPKAAAKTDGAEKKKSVSNCVGIKGKTGNAIKRKQIQNLSKSKSKKLKSTDMEGE